MKHTRLVLSLTLVAALMLVGVGLAAVEAFNLNWWTVDSGGGYSSGGDYTLQGSIGQPDAGALSSGNYSLSGGFQLGGTERTLFLPLVRR